MEDYKYMKYKLLTLVLCISLLILSGFYTIKIEKPESQALSPSLMRPTSSWDENNKNNSNKQSNDDENPSEEYKEKNFTLKEAEKCLKKSLDEENVNIVSAWANRSIAITNYLMTKEKLNKN